MKELNKDILNIQASNSSNIDEYSFTVREGKVSTNVILKLDINPKDEISKEDISNELIRYLSAFEEISA